MNLEIWPRTRAGVSVVVAMAVAAALPLSAKTAATGHPPSAPSALDPEFGVGSWIWDHEIHDRQKCRFVRSFEIPQGATVESACLRITADNYYVLFLDGHEIGRGADWRVLIEYDLRLLVRPGRHVIAVEAFNDFDTAGFLMGLRIGLKGGGVLEISSDDSWRIAPDNDPLWNEPGHLSDKWRSPQVLYPFWRMERPLIYQAPISRPFVVHFWQEDWFQIFLVLTCVTAGSGCILLFSKLVMKSKMEVMVRRERARIAADLHDGLGGGLTQLVLLGDVSKRAIPADSAAVESLDRLCGQTRELLRGMNEAVWLINSQRDNLRDFASYIGKYAESFFHDTSIRCRFVIEKSMPAIACDIGMRRNLFLVVKEALNNILRHSQASEVILSVRHDWKMILITISDNGIGFLPGTVEGSGNGLENMRQRVAEAAGSFEIRNNPEGGMTVSLSAPMQLRARVGFLGFLKRKGAGTCISGTP